MAVKLGPMGMNFVNDVRVAEQDGTTGTVRLSVTGRDKRGKGGADASVDARISDDERRDQGVDGHRRQVLGPGGPARAARGDSGRLQPPRRANSHSACAFSSTPVPARPDAEREAQREIDRTHCQRHRPEREVEPRSCSSTPPRAARPDRHEHRLRHVVVRRVHRPRRRRVGEELHDARRPGRRQRGHTIEGLASGRRAAPDAAGVHGEPRAAVRLLHAGDDHGGGQPARRAARPERAECARPRGQPVPLHRLPQHRQGGAGRRRARGGRDGDHRDSTADASSARASSARRTRRCSPARPASPTTSTSPALCISARPQPVRPRPHHVDRRRRRRRAPRASSPCTPAPTSQTPGPRRCRARGRSPTT